MAGPDPTVSAQTGRKGTQQDTRNPSPRIGCLVALGSGIPGSDARFNAAAGANTDTGSKETARRNHMIVLYKGEL